MENIEIVHIKSFPYKKHLDEINEIVFEAVKSKYLITFNGDEEGIKDMIFSLVKKGLFPLNDGFFAVDKNTEKPVGLLIFLTDKKPPLFKALKHSVGLMLKLGKERLSMLSKGVSIIDSETNRFLDSDNVTFINLVAVSNKYKRQGIGKGLINFAVDNVKSRCNCVGSDCSCKINLLCSSEGFLKEFYKSLGFKVILEVEYDELANVLGIEYRKIAHMSNYL